MTTALVVVALAFAFINGFNDGGALLSVGLDVRTLRPLTSLLLLTLAVAVAPVLIGTAVATTLTSRLVRFDGPEGAVTLLIAVVAAVLVTWLLAARGLPTSLTLAVVGAIAGAGVGAGLPVSWGIVVGVLVLAALAPVAGLALAWLIARIAGAWPSSRPIDRRTQRWHVGAFSLQCVAYGANDGQKMLAVIAVAAGTATRDGVPIVAWQLVAVALAFLVGAAVGLPRVAPTLGGGVTAVHPHEAVISELSSASVVLATGMVGSPVSMTQAISGGLVGTGVTRGYASIRWGQVLRLAVAWVVTLPAAFVVAAAASAIAAVR